MCAPDLLESQFVIHVALSGSTDSEYTMVSGASTYTQTTHIAHSLPKELWKAADGREMRASISEALDVTAAELEGRDIIFRCLEGETILQSLYSHNSGAKCHTEPTQASYG